MVVRCHQHHARSTCTCVDTVYSHRVLLVFCAAVYYILHVFCPLHHTNKHLLSYPGTMDTKKCKAVITDIKMVVLKSYGGDEQTDSIKRALGLCESTLQTIHVSTEKINKSAKSATKSLHLRSCIPELRLWRE